MILNLKNVKENVLKLLNNNYYFITALLMPFSFPTFEDKIFSYFYIIAWISLVPVFLYMRRIPLKEVYAKSFILGMIANYFTYGWMGSFGNAVPNGDIILLVFFIPVITIYWSVTIFIAEYFSRKCERLRIIIYPSVWILFDFQKTIGLFAFPWTFFGYSQYPFDSFIQLSSITGIQGITFLVVFGNYLLSDIIHNRHVILARMKNYKIHHIVVISIAFTLFMVIVITYGNLRIANSSKIESPGKKIKIAMIQSCISPWDYWRKNRFKYLSTLTQLTNMSLEENPDFIVWSESATIERLSLHSQFDPDELFYKKLTQYIAAINKPLLTGEIGVSINPVTYKTKYHNSAVLFNSDGEVVDSYNKIHIVPIGEWFPYEKLFPFVTDLIVKMGASNFTPGRKPLLFNVKGVNFGTVICYESLFYRLNSKYKKMGADYLINITNDGWTHFYQGHLQHYSAAKFRAVENGLWFVRCGNTGYTSIVNPYGIEKSSIPILTKGYLVYEIDTSMNTDTVYTKYGDIIVVIAAIFIAILMINNVYMRFWRKNEI